MNTVLVRNSPLIKRISAIALVIACLTSILSWELIANAWMQYNKAQDNITQFSDFYQVLNVSNKLAEERGFANQLIFSSGNNRQAARAAFHKSQNLTDQALKKIPDEILSSTMLQNTLSYLLRGRAEVEEYVAGPKDDASGAQIAVDAMMEATEYFHNILFIRTESFIKMEPSALGAILQGQALGGLRNSTGKLGSYFLYYLNTGLPLTEPQLEKISKEWAKIEIQWWLLGAQTDEVKDSAKFRELMLKTRHNFQNKGASLVRMLQTQSENREPYSIGVEEFSIRFQNSLSSFNDLLQMYLSDVHRYYSNEKKSALYHLVMTLITLFLVYALALVVVIYIHSGVVKPLMKINLRVKSMGVDEEELPHQTQICEIKALETTLNKLEEHIDEKRMLSDELKLLAEKDALTGVLNRRGFEMKAQHLLEQEDSEAPAWLILLDIDHFKHINDTWGHPVGDKVLASLGKALQQIALADWIVARVGGEEFAIMFRMADKQDVLRYAWLLQMTCKNLRVAADNGVEIRFTASFGIARTYHCGLPAMMSEADKALYRSKKAGRDRISGFDEQT